MTLKQMAFPIQMALLLVVNLAVAADDDDGSPSTEGPDIWFGKECTISDSKNSRNMLYMSSFWTGRMVSYKKFSKPEKKAKWFISPVNTGDKTFYEFKNIDRKTYIAPFSSKGKVSGNFDKFSKTDKTNTLWTIDPAKQGVPVSIKNYKGQFLNKPKNSDKSHVRLSDSETTKWFINCK